MHELTIITNILNIVEENARLHNAFVVHEIELEIGELAGVEFDALEFAIEHSHKSEILKNVKFNIKRITPLVRCIDCRNEYETAEYISQCRKCNSFRNEIIKGNELRINSFRME